jgi:cytochrome P450
VADLGPTTEAITAGLLDEIGAAGASGGVVDVIRSLAYPLPVRIICSLLGVPATDEATFTGWSRALARSLDPSVLRSAEMDAAIADAERDLAAYLGDLLSFRRATPGDDLLSALLVVEADGDRVSPKEVVDLALLLLVAGHETTVNLIGNGVLALLRAPDQLDLLRRSPDLVAGAVDELLRFDSPVQMTQRVAIEDLELAGYRVRAGDEICSFWAQRTATRRSLPSPTAWTSPATPAATSRSAAASITASARRSPVSRARWRCPPSWPASLTSS